MGKPYEKKVKCDGCNKHKSEEFFSRTGLAKYENSKKLNERNSKAPIKPIRCMACNRSNRDELQCSQCSVTYPLEKFNKAQRKKGDDAMCLDCSQEKIDREPDHQNEVEEVAIINEMKQDTLREYTMNSSRHSSVQQSRRSARDSQYETETNPGSDYYAGNDAVSLVSGGSTYISTSSRPTTGTKWDAYQGIARPTGTSRSGSNVGFVKQNAVPRNMVEKATAQYERERRRAQEQEDIVRDQSDDDEDDEDEPY